MMSRLAAVAVLLSVAVMGTVSPAEACAIGCLGSHRGHGHHEAMAAGMSGHHHAGMMHMAPLSHASFASRVCEDNCSRRLVMVQVEKSQLSQERLSGETNLQPGDEGVRTAEGECDAVAHFEVAGPPGPASCGMSILRI